MLKAIRAVIRNSVLCSFWQYAVVCDGNVHYAFSFAEALEWTRCYKTSVFGSVTIRDSHGDIVAVKY